MQLCSHSLFTATCCFVYALPRQTPADTAICHHTWPMCSDVPHPTSSAHNTALSSPHAISIEHRLLHSPSPPRENIRHSMRCRRRDMTSSASTPVSHTQPLAANHRRSRITYATTDPTNSPTASPAKSDKLEADADPALHRRPASLLRHLFQPCHAQRGTSNRATSQRASLNAVHHKLCGAMISSSCSTTCTPLIMDLPSLSVELSAGHKKKETPTEGGWGGGGRRSRHNPQHVVRPNLTCCGYHASTVVPWRIDLLPHRCFRVLTTSNINGCINAAAASGSCCVLFFVHGLRDRHFSAEHNRPHTCRRHRRRYRRRPALSCDTRNSPPDIPSA